MDDPIYSVMEFFLDPLAVIAAFLIGSVLLLWIFRKPAARLIQKIRTSPTISICITGCVGVIILIIAIGISRRNTLERPGDPAAIPKRETVDEFIDRQIRITGLGEYSPETKIIRDDEGFTNHIVVRFLAVFGDKPDPHTAIIKTKHEIEDSILEFYRLQHASRDNRFARLKRLSSVLFEARNWTVDEYGQTTQTTMMICIVPKQLADKIQWVNMDRQRFIRLLHDNGCYTWMPWTWQYFQGTYKDETELY